MQIFSSKEEEEGKREKSKGEQAKELLANMVELTWLHP